MINIPRFSVVIATLGEGRLRESIESLNAGSIKPDQILICIPKSEVFKISGILENFPNLMAVETDGWGQVYQRSRGFQAASFEYVLQLDDDVLVTYQCCEILIKQICRNENIAIAPKLRDIYTNKFHSYLTPANKYSIFEKLIYWVINGRDGFQGGKISKSGVNMGVLDTSDHSIFVEWLPGCCVMHRKKNLFIENFYPYSGKAFAEDLIHSHCLRVRNIKLVISHDAVAMVDFRANTNFKLWVALKNYSRYIRAMKYFNRIRNVNNLRLYLFIFLDLIRRAYGKLINA